MISRHRLWQVATDTVLVSVALYAAFLWRFDFSIPGGTLHNYWHLLWSVLPYVALLKVLTFVGFGLYNKWWRYSGIRDLTAIIRATLVASVIGRGRRLAGGALRAAGGPHRARSQRLGRSLPLGVIALDWMLTLFLVGGARLVARIAWERPWRQQLSRDRKRVLVVGAGDAGELVVREMLKTRMIRYQPVGFVDDDPRKKNLQIHGVRVVGTTRRLTKLVEEHAAEEVIIAIPSVRGSVVQDIVTMCKKANVSVRTLPGVYELIKGSVTIEQLREVQVEDILGRGEVSVDLADVADLIRSRTVMVTGAGGSIGSEMCRQIAAMNPRRLLLVDHAEDNLFNIHHELETERHVQVAVPIVADVKDTAKVQLIFEEHRPHLVFHAAAYKHVPMMEANPREAFENNTLATLGLARAGHRPRGRSASSSSAPTRPSTPARSWAHRRPWPSASSRRWRKSSARPS